MKREQLDGKFIICRTQEETEFIIHWAKKLLGHDEYVPRFLPCAIRLKDGIGWDDPGYYELHKTEYGCDKEEECSVLFGNLVKEWVKNGRT